MDIVGIAYIGWESTNPKSMIDYGPEVFGFGLNESINDDSVYLTMDDKLFRIAVHPGEQNRMAYLGWLAKGKDAWEAGVEQLRAAGVDVTVCDSDVEEQRGCLGVAQFCDPAGWPHELAYGQHYDTNTFRPGRGHNGFDTEQGVGHVAVMGTPDLDEMNRFNKEVMEHKWYIHGPGKGVAAFWRAKHSTLSHNIAYMRNPSHQYGDTTMAPHMGLYNKKLDDVGIAYDRVLDNNPDGIMMTLGRHTQDPVISFYSTTPAGFAIEFIWAEDLHVPDETYVEGSASRLSVWGHRLPNGQKFGA